MYNMAYGRSKMYSHVKYGVCMELTYHVGAGVTVAGNKDATWIVTVTC